VARQRDVPDIAGGVIAPSIVALTAQAVNRELVEMTLALAPVSPELTSGLSPPKNLQPEQLIVL